ncbi:xanthine dehydrogenase family protein molybdopterin-binding subunit [Spongiibacter nanhainus]|uniref:Xanthine dehydrogenase family protein molybdopterin-binding subunit n=1 Tax=Spongiibacter nanhainus TaxID=2794344 RepID=A0A7T4R200_9GAMM|nr:molybdopterin cofactor-binding domain-containing protein [Spongiibacter nanhainus]QQD18988.1 xanthine dehydrogenase family protein molybdopterin-binding subunit [Spongiibacter nanhainus]
MSTSKINLPRSQGISRRHFLQLSALAGGGLLVACGGGGSGSSSPNNTPDGPGGGEPSEVQQTELGEFMRIGSDGSITVLVGASEIGQGALTAIPMIVAEEMDADWDRVKAEHSPVAAQFNNPYFGSLLQWTVASSSIRGFYDPQREVGATVRHMLIQAAARRWEVPAETLTTERGYVIDEANGRTAGYGELAAAAAEEPVPTFPAMKDPSQFRIIGTNRQRLDIDSKVDGSMQYGIDVDLPGMLTAVIARPPRFGGQPLSVDDNAARAVPGVRDVFSIVSGVAIVADDFWSAEQGRKALEVQWAELLAGRTDSQATRSTYGLKLNLPGVPLRIDGLALLAQTLASQTFSADYHFPFMAHAAMEPLNVVVDYRGSRADIWTGSQSPTLDKVFAAATLGLLPAQINFHNMPSGGGFGRRGNPVADYVRDACQVARQLQQPVKVIWTREDDMKGGFYRPAAANRLSASVDNAGNITAWTHRSVTQDVTALLYVEEIVDIIADTELPPLKELTDLEVGMPYDIDNVLMDFHLEANLNMPALWMRSVNKFTDVFAQETFFDTVAQQMGREPYQFRRQLLANRPRHLAVLDAAAQAANWGAPSQGTHQGIAVMHHWKSWIAQVVEISINSEREVTIHRVVSAVDCGTAINPDLVVAQIESAVIFALSSVLFGEITLEDGVVQQTNFDDYPVLRMYQTPQIDTVIVDSGNDPGGVGEIGVPCVGPALANAIFAATGEPIRELPLKNLGYRFA